MKYLKKYGWMLLTGLAAILTLGVVTRRKVEGKKRERTKPVIDAMDTMEGAKAEKAAEVVRLAEDRENAIESAERVLETHENRNNKDIDDSWNSKT